MNEYVYTTHLLESMVEDEFKVEGANLLRDDPCPPGAGGQLAILLQEFSLHT
jgi:hypothetical protein